MPGSDADAIRVAPAPMHAPSSRTWAAPPLLPPLPPPRVLQVTASDAHACCCCACRFVPDPSLQPVSTSQPKLDVSAAGRGGDQELWLLQMPNDVSTPLLHVPAPNSRSELGGEECSSVAQNGSFVIGCDGLGFPGLPAMRR